MRPFRYFAPLALFGLIALPVQAQNSLSVGSASVTSESYTRNGGITLTQSTVTTVSSGGVACASTASPAFTTENLIHRVFPLAASGVTGPITIASIDVGVGGINADNVQSFDSKLTIAKMRGGVNLAAAFAYTDYVGVETVIFPITSAMEDGVFPVAMAGGEIFMPTDTLVVVWETPDGTENPEAQFGARMGGNSGGETAPTYLGTLVSCGPLPPTPITAIGTFDNSQWVLVVNANASSATEGGPAGASIQIGAPAPNPVARTASIPFTLESASEAKVSVFDMLGREVAVLANGPFAAGSHDVGFDGANLTAGTYVVRLIANGTVVSRTLSVAR